MQREFTSKIDELHEKYSKVIEDLTNDFILLKHFILAKEKFNSFLIGLLSEVHLYFTESNISSLQRRMTGKYTHKNDLEKQALAEEITRLRDEIQYYKEICGILQKETDKAMKSMNHYKTELDAKHLKQEVKTLKNIILQKDKLIAEKKNQTDTQ